MVELFLIKSTKGINNVCIGTTDYLGEHQFTPGLEQREDISDVAEAEKYRLNGIRWCITEDGKVFSGFTLRWEHSVTGAQETRQYGYMETADSGISTL